MKMLALLGVAAASLSLAACGGHDTNQAQAVENTGDNAAQALNNAGDQLENAAAAAPNNMVESNLENAAGNAHAAADQVKQMANNKADAIDNSAGH